MSRQEVGVPEMCEALAAALAMKTQIANLHAFARTVRDTSNDPHLVRAAVEIVGWEDK